MPESRRLLKITGALSALLLSATATAQTVFINEIHYDNDGGDVNEAVEIAGPAGTDLSGWSVVGYTGSNGTEYDSITLSGTIDDEASGFGALDFSFSGLQNGAPDGIALADDGGNLVQFLCYEGDFTGSGGVADGVTCEDIGVAEGSSTGANQSLRLTGTGTEYLDFTWQDPATASFGSINPGQTFGMGVPGGDPLACGADATLISAIQGDGASSPLDGTTVTVEAVVTADFQDGDLNAFFLQEEAADSDGDDATSEGIKVFQGGSDVAVAVGELVRVTGDVDEFFDATQISSVTDVIVCGAATPITPLAVDLPFASPDQRESLEHMLLTFNEPLSVSEYFELDNFGEIVLASGGRLFNPTQVVMPGMPANDRQAANDLRRVRLDDASGESFPDPIIYPNGELTDENPLRGGDTVTGLTGVYDFTFGNYKIQPTQMPVFVSQNPRSDHPAPAPTPSPGSFRIASFNVLNYFNGDGQGGGFPTARGAETPEEFTRQRDKIIEALRIMDADVVGLIEIENDGYGPDSAIADLVNGLNAATPDEVTYAFVDPQVPQIGDDEIAVGFIYRTDTAATVGPAAILDDSVDPDYLESKNRPALAQTFRDIDGGGVVTVAVNHLKSKGSACDDVADPNADDGQGNCNGTRTQAAQIEADWLASNPTGSDDDDRLIIGDLNAYAMEDPIRTLQMAGYTDLLQSLIGTDVYSYVFDGQFGTLDYAMASDTLVSQVTGIDAWHINADEADALDYNILRFGSQIRSESQIDSLYNVNAFRSSDHDPIIVDLNLMPDGSTDDRDNDGVLNDNDNCPDTPNPNQTDSNNDGQGNLCTPFNADDTDGDGVDNVDDNCPTVPNPDQTDVDNDGAGNACDTVNNLDPDNDGINTAEGDNCPTTFNPTQTDSDGDGAGDACDLFGGDDGMDNDFDGVLNGMDNCPENPNPDQADADQDGIGDACDAVTDDDTDGDNVPNGGDNCPTAFNPDQLDLDEDGIGDVCDPINDRDTDGDGVENGQDNCLYTPNPDQNDRDQDGAGDACDSSDVTDIDADGVSNANDNCPATPNPDQADQDGDGRGDACDGLDGNDPDGDGVSDANDNCPFAPNAGQEDDDADGLGNACDATDNNAGGIAQANQRVEIAGGAGETLGAGRFALTNNSMEPHRLQSVSIELTEPGLLRRMEVTAADQTLDCGDDITANNLCAAETAIVIEPGESLELSVSVVLDGQQIAMAGAGLGGGLLLLLAAGGGLTRRQKAIGAILFGSVVLTACGGDGNGNSAGGATPASSQVFMSGADIRDGQDRSVDYGLQDQPVDLGTVTRE